MTFLAVEAASTAELGAVLAAEVGRAVPHDGYHLLGLDPVSGVLSFHVTRHGYGLRSLRELERELWPAGAVLPFPGLFSGPTPVGVLGVGCDGPGVSVRLRELMRADGIGSELRIALALDGRFWGGLVLVRGHGGRPFSAADALRAEALAKPLARALRGFVAGKPLRVAPYQGPPGVAVAGPDGTVRSATSGFRDWLRAHLPDPTRDYGDPPRAIDNATLSTALCNLIGSARRAPDGAAVSRVLTPDGLAVLHAQPLCDPDPDPEAGGDTVITIQTATAEELLPAVAAWYGITPRERQVVRHALEGLAAKSIARRLELSPHTVNDHLGAVYRKLGVSGRDELFACLHRRTTC